MKIKSVWRLWIVYMAISLILVLFTAASALADASVSGSAVTADAGFTLSNMSILQFTDDGMGNFNYTNQFSAAADNTFNIGTIAAGNHKFKLTAPGFYGQYYTDKYSLDEAAVIVVGSTPVDLGTLTLQPVKMTVTLDAFGPIPAEGGTFDLGVNVTNNDDVKHGFLGWVILRSRGGAPYGEDIDAYQYMGTKAMRIPGGATGKMTFSCYFSAEMVAHPSYYFNVMVTDIPNWVARGYNNSALRALWIPTKKAAYRQILKDAKCSSASYTNLQFAKDP